MRLGVAISAVSVMLAIEGVASAEEQAKVETSSEPARAPEEKTVAPAAAKPPRDDAKGWETAPAEHRGGFAVGIMASAGLGASNGYPADAKKIGRLAFYTESGLGFMGASGLWIGGALAEWLTFGAGAGYTTILNGDTVSPAPYVFFHTDLYPLFWLGGQWRNLGAMADFGLGFPVTKNSDTDETLIDGTGASFVQAGVFWEGIEAWKLKMGPYVSTHYMWSDTIRRPSALVGFRLSLYTAP
ncbi:MAG: hypothetical protein HOW73_22280 [Polyangiaceae bacterium]|nr:hypothetical protein [Polyangiaceae bacterium]